MLSQMRSDIFEAYGDLSSPQYFFVQTRLDSGMHKNVLLELSRSFVVENETSPGGDDVCLVISVRPRDAKDEWVWRVQLSLVGKYATVTKIDRASKNWPLIDAPEGSDDARLLEALRKCDLLLVPLEILKRPTELRPPGAKRGEVYTIYNVLFSFAVPFAAFDG